MGQNELARFDSLKSILDFNRQRDVLQNQQQIAQQINPNNYNSYGTVNIPGVTQPKNYMYGVNTDYIKNGPQPPNPDINLQEGVTTDQMLGYGGLALGGINMLGNMYAAHKNYQLQKDLQNYLKSREAMNDRNQQAFARNVGGGATSGLDNK
jgi:hypothetical protein